MEISIKDLENGLLAHGRRMTAAAIRHERARIRKELLKAAQDGLHSAIFAETQSKPRHACDYTDAAMRWLRAELDRICPEGKETANG